MQDGKQRLSPNEYIVFKAIKQYRDREGCMPTIREIHREAISLGLTSHSLRSVFNYLSGLEEKGYLRRGGRVARGLELIEPSGSFISIPVLGIGSAGVPTSIAEERIEGYLKVSETLLDRRPGLFAVQAEGDSMNQAKINGKRIKPGSYVLIDPEIKEFSDGNIVLAVIDGLATIKIYRQLDERTIGLFPCSNRPGHRPIYLTDKDNFVFNGKVVDVFDSDGDQNG